MTTAVEDITSTKKRLKIEIPTEVIEKEYTSSLNKIRQNAKIPGFRPGKAPMNLVEKKFGGDITSDIIDRLVPQYYSDALKDAELVPVTLPEFETSPELKRHEPLSFSLTVEVRPKVADLRYTGLKVDDVPVEVEEKEIEETINGLREGRAMYDVVDREIRADDLIVIDYVKFDPSGERQLSSAKDQVMNLGNNLAPSGILDGLLGKKKGDVVEIVLPGVQGEEVMEGEGDLLRITVKEVKEKKLPEIDEEFAKDFGHESLESLREKVKEGILKAKNEKAASGQKTKLLDALLESHDFDIPEALLNRELDNLVMNEKLQQKKSGGLLKEAGGEGQPPQEDDSQIAERLRPKATRNAKSMILLDMIAEKEGITVSEDEMKTKILLLARHLQTTPDAVVNLFMTKDGSLENLRHTIRDEKVMDAVLSKAEIVKGA